MNRKPTSSPEAVIVAITGKCNLKCKYCFYSDEMVALKDLPTNTWLDFFVEMKEAGVMRVNLSGGEVFARKDIIQLIQGIVDNKMRFSILSNGTLITEEIALFLDSVRRRFDYIQISIDGSGPETHDRIRGRGSFEKMMKGIALLKQYQFDWVVRVTINKLNLHDLKATLYMLHDDLGLRRFDVNEAFPRGAGQCNTSSLEMTPEERRLSFQIMEEFDRKHPGVVSGGQAGPLVMKKYIDKVNAARDTGKFDVNFNTGTLSGCNIMWNKISVLHDGTFVPCHQLPQIPLGKIGEDRLLDVWHNSEGLINLRKRYKIPLESIPNCKGCPYQKYCTGGCPGVGYAYTGEINNINPLSCYRALIGEDEKYEF